MGWLKSKNGIIGDGPLDIIGDAIEAVKKEYNKGTLIGGLDREPTLEEIRDVFNYVMAPLEEQVESMQLVNNGV